MILVLALLAVPLKGEACKGRRTLIMLFSSVGNVRYDGVAVTPPLWSPGPPEVVHKS